MKTLATLVHVHPGFLSLDVVLMGNGLDNKTGRTRGALGGTWRTRQR
ncbi:hypothetical protein NITHO_3970002 [Nitrolancea hollandica Lb]|uniref:Uncharacterized protein n=1 Tax=Nitrolancea hollandica Lb TaxID=1129897 RepID=I4EJD2_9BACT|nr:hypothetical protein NITHO_3970002 [Nitrolancea hollandica Lb]